MSDGKNIIFDCPECRQGIEAAANAAGKMAACPNCGKDVRVPGSVSGSGIVESPLLLQNLAATMPDAQSEATPQINRKSKGMAIAGLVLGIISIVPGFVCGGPIWAVLGIIFSSVALSRISKHPDQYEGEGLAIAGLIISIVGFVINLVALFLFGFMGASMAATLAMLREALGKLPK